VGALFLQILNIKVLKGPEYRQKAAQSQHRNQLSQVYRGRIVDRNGIVLAQDTLVYDLYIHPSYYQEQPLEQVAGLLAKHLSQSPQEILRKLRLPYPTILLASNLEKKTVDALRRERLTVTQKDEKTGEMLLDKKTGQPLMASLKIEGLDPFQKPLRRYPQGRLASHVLGYVNDAASISTGVHSRLDALSSHWFKQERQAPLLVDGKGRPLTHDEESLKHFVEVAEAQDVQLTLDSRLQFIAERELKAGLAYSKAERGALIMVKPQTGEILALASFPDFDPESFQKARYEDLKNWAITDVYEPGSTIKILTVANGLDEGVITPSSHILDTGRMCIGGWWIQNYDYHKSPHPGNINLIYLLQHSSNIASAKIALMLPSATYYKRLKALGFGKQTGISMTGESQGMVDDPQTWSASHHASLGYGYGLMSTPLQMTMAVNTIANGGIWVPPRLIKGVHAKHVEDSTQYAKDLRQHLRQPAPHRVYRAETAQAMTRLLTQALDNNKTHPAYLGFMRVAGKTGTAKKARGGGYANGGLVTSFSGYFPAESPEIMMMVVVDSPKMAESWGSTVAAPIFRRVALESIHYLNLAPKTSIKVAPLPAVSSTSTPKPTPERVTPEPLMNTQTHAPRAVEASTAKPLRASVKVPG
jgi:cell division protein FtsI (penicillin-binding protein 3)